MDISASTNLVLVIDNDDIPGLYSFEISIGTGDGVGSGVTVTVGGGYLDTPDTGPSGNWDVYKVPLADFTGSYDWTTTMLGGIQFNNPENFAGAQIAGTIHFDDIHFE